MSKDQRIIHSHSSVAMFEGCEHKYHQVRIERNFEEEQNEQAAFGDKQHEIAENALMNDTPITGPMGDALEWVRSHTGLKIAEQHIAIDRKLKPCGYYDKERAWFRAKVDVIILNGDHATIVDYKTGKRRVPWEQRDDPNAKPSEDQMLRYALLVFLTYPHVKTIDAYLYFTHLGEAVRDEYKYDRNADAKKMVRFIRKTPQEIERAKASDVWEPTGNDNAPALCKGWCPVKTCTHWKPRRYNR